MFLKIYKNVRKVEVIDRSGKIWDILSCKFNNVDRESCFENFHQSMEKKLEEKIIKIEFYLKLSQNFYSKRVLFVSRWLDNWNFLEIFLFLNQISPRKILFPRLIRFFNFSFFPWDSQLKGARHCIKVCQRLIHFWYTFDTFWYILIHFDTLWYTHQVFDTFLIPFWYSVQLPSQLFSLSIRIF